MLLGVDWGVSYDQSAAVAIARLPVAPWNPGREPAAVFGVASVELWPPGAQLNRVAEDVAASRGEWAMFSPEETGVGAGPSQELHRLLRQRTAARQRELVGFEAWHDVPTPTANPVATTAAKKAAAYGAIRYLLEEGRLVLPRHPELLRQLAGLRFEVGDRGHLRIEAEDAAVHDDVADALMLAAGPYRPTGQRASTRVALQELAARSIPEAPLPAGAGELETVVTPGGLRLARRPFLQSVAGAELTLPPREGESWDAERGAGGPRLDPAVLSARREIEAARREREEGQWT